MSTGNRLFLILGYRELLTNLVRRNLKVRYKGSALGFLWSFLNPLLLMLVYSAVFSKIMRVQTADIPYPVFFFSGLIPWIFVSSTISVSLNSFLENGSLIKKVFLPLEVIPVSVVVSNLVNLLLSFVVLAGILIFTGWYPNAAWLLLPVPLVLQLSIALGLALFFSSMNVFFRDIGNMTEAITLSWFFLSPVVYPAETYVPAGLMKFYELNPMCGILTMYRNILFRGSLIPARELAVTAAFSLFVFLAGAIVFSRVYRKIPEEV